MMYSVTNKWSLLTISAIIYSLAFVYGNIFWWLTFLFLVPLIYCALHYNLSFKEGYYWGFLMLTLHMHGVLYSVMCMAEGPFYCRIIPSLVCVAYASFYSAFFFWLGNSVARKNLLIWILIFWSYIYVMEHYCLWIFGICEGYFLIHPLLPLAHYPQLLWLLPYVGKSFLTLILVMISAIMSAVCYKFNGTKLLYVVLLSLFFVPGLFIVHDNSCPAWLNKIGYLPLLSYDPIQLSRMANTVGTILKEFIREHPHVQIVIMPESALYTSAFTTIPELLKSWDSEHIGKPLHVIFGAFRWEDDKRYNTLHWVYDGTLQAYYDKRHAMLLTERMPAWCDMQLVKDLYFGKEPPIAVSTTARPLLKIMPEIELVPYICSELFFNDQPDDNFEYQTILALCNDRWIRGAYVADLMYLIARFKAVQWQRDIVYISYTHAGFVGKYGVECSI